MNKKLTSYKLLTTFLILFFTLQSWAKADDIRDFEIEGMSIGDNALEHFTKEELNNAEKFTYPSKKFSEIFTHSSNYKIYDSVTISLMEGKYKIYGISGVIDYREKNFEDCLKAKNDIIDELKITFKNSKIIDNGTYQTPDYAGDKSKRSQVELLLNQNGGVVSVDCVDWSKEAEKKHGWGDNLSITLYSKEYERFVRSL